MSFILLIGLLQAQFEVDKFERAELPRQIRGVWDSSAEACANEDSTSRLVLGANWFKGYEVEGTLLVLGPAHVEQFDSIEARFGTSAEGTTSIAQHVYGWSADSSKLFAYDPIDLDKPEAPRPPTMLLRCSHAEIREPNAPN